MTRAARQDFLTWFPDDAEMIQRLVEETAPQRGS